MEEKRRKKKRGYKFTGKKVSKRGMVSVLTSVPALTALGAVVWMSYENRGNGSIYLGIIGILAMILSLISVIIALWGFREENAFKVLPAAGLCLGLISAGFWVVIYARGFM